MSEYRNFFREDSRLRAALNSIGLDSEDIEYAATEIREKLDNVLINDAESLSPDETLRLLEDIPTPTFTEQQTEIINSFWGKGNSVSDAIGAYGEEFGSAEKIVFTFIQAAKNKIWEVLNNHDAEMKSAKKLVNKNEEWLIRNRILNWLRIPGIIPTTNPEVRYEEAMTDFVTEDSPNPVFADRMITYKNGAPIPFVVEGNDVAEIAGGNGRDQAYYITKGKANSVTSVDSSPAMLQRQRERREKLPTELKEKMIVPNAPQEMHTFFQERAQKIKDGEEHLQFDGIISFGSAHYFSKKELKELISLEYDCLKDGGYCALGVKIPNKKESNEDNQSTEENPYITEGILLDDSKYPIVLGSDGLVRHFRDPKQIEKIAKNIGFITREENTYVAESYETSKNEQTMTYYIFKKPVPKN